MKVYVNGQIIDKEKAVISIFDRGFLYGDAIFETMRSYSGKVFRINEHFGRLYTAMKFLKIRQPLADKEAEKVVYELLGVNGLADARIRITVSRGASLDGRMDISKSGSSSIVIIAEEYAPLPDKYYEKGAAVGAARSRRNSQTVLKNFKIVNYLDSILARNEAISKGFFDIIFLNDAGYVSEGSTSNVFMVSGTRLLTPSLDCGALPGITRRLVLEMSRYAGVGVEEGKFREEQLKIADEVFITNSIFEIMPVIRVEDRVIGSGLPGKITRKMRDLYRDLVNKECRNTGNVTSDQ